MMSRFRTLWVPALGLVVLALPAAAQDGGAPKPPPQAESPSADAGQLLQRMRDLYARALSRPKLDPDAPDKAKALAAHANAQVAWEKTIKDFAKAGDQYVATIGDTAPDAEALYYRGVGRYLATQQGSSSEAQAGYTAAADALSRYVQACDEKAAFLADAERYLGQSLVFLSRGDLARFDEAVPHLRRSVVLFQRDGRHDEAGEAAHAALEPLVGLNRGAEAREFSDAIHADDADFGASTPTVRKWSAASRFALGQRLPALPQVKDVDGNPIDFGAQVGRPLLLHFFLTGFANGAATSFHDIDKAVLPLWRRLREKGLSVVGVCMDNAMSAAQAETMRKNWDEWGRKEELRDGSLESCRAWAKKQGIEWPWQWDGLWVKNPVSLALGGVGASEPYAVLVDGGGIVRWRGGAGRGAAPFEGLAEEIAKLVQ